MFLHRTCKDKYTLKKTEGAIKNGQFIETGNIGYTRHRTKTNKAKQYSTENKNMSITDHNKTRGQTLVLA